MKTNELFTMNSARTRAAKAAYKQYRYGWYAGHSLRDVYDRYSAAKADAEDYCLDLCNKLNGRGFVILSACTMTFSVGFLFDDPETGAERFAYITRDYNSTCEI